MSGSLRIEHVELALDPQTPFHLNFERESESVASALELAVASSDRELARRAVGLCGHVCGRTTLSVLLGAAVDPRASVREAVAAALVRRRDDPPALLAMLLLDEAPRVRARALTTLAFRPAYRRVRHLVALKRLRADPDPGVRGMARRVGVFRGMERKATSSETFAVAR